MKRSMSRTLVSFAALGLTGFTVRAQENPEAKTLVIRPGNDFRAAVDKGVRLKKIGQPVTAKLLEPVYAGESVAIPAGSTINGHVSAINTVPIRKRVGKMLGGDFTPPKFAQVEFDELVLSDGTALPIHTNSAVGLGRMANSRYVSADRRPGAFKKIKGAVTTPLKEPHKMQRLGEAVVTSLPYHPNYIDQGTVFDAALLEPVSVRRSVEPDPVPMQLASDYLHLRLLTPIDSNTSLAGAPIEAVVSEPFYQGDHQLIYPAGTRITGTVEKATPTGWMKKNGSVIFAFRSISMPDGTMKPIQTTVGGIQAEGSQGLEVGKEGEIRATTSPLQRILAPVSLIGPSRAVSDSSVVKTAWSRSGEGRSGFGLLGAGAAQASAGAAIGFGYFGAARKLYTAFIAKGSDVELPAYTPIVLRMDQSEDSIAVATP